MRDLERMVTFMPAAWRRRVASCGGVVHDVDGLAVCLTGVPVGAFNPTLVTAPPADPDIAIVEAERRYDGTGLTIGIDIEPSVHPTVRAAAERAGLTMIESRPGMTARVADVPAIDLPDGIELHRVTDAAVLDDVVAVDVAAFGGEAAVTRRFLPDAVLEDPTQRVYAARLDGRVVAVGESSTLDGVIGVFGVATHPDVRRRGIGTALTGFLIRDRADEADLAVLDASDDGAGVYRRLGFETTSTWEVWARPRS